MHQLIARFRYGYVLASILLIWLGIHFVRAASSYILLGASYYVDLENNYYLVLIITGLLQFTSFTTIFWFATHFYYSNTNHSKYGLVEGLVEGGVLGVLCAAGLYFLNVAEQTVGTSNLVLGLSMYHWIIVTFAAYGLWRSRTQRN